MRMPYQCTERKIKIASAAVVDKSAVGLCTPGRIPAKFAMTIKIHREPTNGRISAEYSGRTASIAFWMAPTIPSSATCQGAGSVVSRRVESQETKHISSMSAQVVKTVSPIIQLLSEKKINVGGAHNNP